jgi:hypothetical protein
MMPSNQALQVCYGTLPLILILIGIWLREQLCSDLLSTMRSSEDVMRHLIESVHKVEKRLVVLETRAGVIYQG